MLADRLKWDVTVRDNWEIDDLDGLDPLYVLSVERGQLFGSLRFLPTTGPTLLSAALATHLGLNIKIQSPHIWECSRFVVAPRQCTQRTSLRVCNVTADLMMAGCLLAQTAGIRQITGVFDKSMLQIYRRAGWVPDVIADATTSTRTIAVGIWDVNADVLACMIHRHGFTPAFEVDPVLNDGAHDGQQQRGSLLSRQGFYSVK